jgi:hypothetical protein
MLYMTVGPPPHPPQADATENICSLDALVDLTLEATPDSPLLDPATELDVAAPWEEAPCPFDAVLEEPQATPAAVAPLASEASSTRRRIFSTSGDVMNELLGMGPDCVS